MTTSTKGHFPTAAARPRVHRSASVTFASQSDLPRLPIPKLQETLEKFPKCLQALQDSEQQKDTEAIVKDFMENDGPKLQALLEQYDEEGRISGKIGSYVEEFWNESYLAPDASVVLNLNPFFVLEEGPDPKIARDQIKRAASLTFAAVKLASSLKHKSLKPDVVRGTPLCMDQFKALFGSCRYPEQHHRDHVEVFPESKHVAVMSRNQLYYFQALWKDGKVAVDERDIMNILEAIKENSNEISQKEASKNCLGVLTSLPRKDWAKIRSNMEDSSETNSESLKIVDSALFVLVLDDYVPADANEMAANMLHGTYKLKKSADLEFYQSGTCCNRWYDKLQMICMADGTTGVNFEHSAIDGHTALRFISDVFAETVVTFAQSITKLIYGDGLPNVIDAEVKRAASVMDETGKPMLDVSPKKLIFNLSTPIVEYIRFAEAALGDQIIASCNVVLEFKTYGKTLITANKMSPDSFVQMSIQLAYYRLYGKTVCTYEPVLTKSFYHGRTEAMRTATPEGADFCRLWDSPVTTKEEKMAALSRATKEHSRLVKESAAAKGIDRHLFALKCIAEKTDNRIPPFFHSEPYKMLNHTVLSTSNCGNPSLRLFGFGPVVQDGFGIGYIIKDHGLQYSVSSHHRQTQRYVDTLEKILLEIQELMNPVGAVRVDSHGRHEMKTVPESSTVDDVDGYESIYGEAPEENDTKFFAAVMPRKLTFTDKSSINLRVSNI